MLHNSFYIPQNSTYFTILSFYVQIMHFFVNMRKHLNTNPMAMEKKQPIFKKILYQVYEEATISTAQVFVNAEVFQNGNLDSADARQQVFAYQ